MCMMLIICSYFWFISLLGWNSLQATWNCVAEAYLAHSFERALPLAAWNHLKGSKNTFLLWVIHVCFVLNQCYPVNLILNTLHYCFYQTLKQCLWLNNEHGPAVFFPFLQMNPSLLIAAIVFLCSKSHVNFQFIHFVYMAIDTVYTCVYLVAGEWPARRLSWEGENNLCNKANDV